LKIDFIARVELNLIEIILQNQTSLSFCWRSACQICPTRDAAGTRVSLAHTVATIV